jgi:pimeloyl-ACP methyl ester carboxylesterase
MTRLPSGGWTGKVLSRDGTSIAFERVGEGPPLVLVDGALCYRASGPMRPLAALLAHHFTVFLYDRRGRGESGNVLPYAVEREIEDVEAMIQAAGGWAFLFGISSGAALALAATRSGLAVRRLGMYEAPFIVDDRRPPVSDEFLAHVDALVAANRRSDTVKQFMKAVGVPGLFIALMRFLPAWSRLTAVAHTVPYDFAIMRDYQKGRPLPAAWATMTVPTMAIDGGKSPAWMRNGMRALAEILPNVRYETLPGQTHMVSAKVLAPVLEKFFTSDEVGATAYRPHPLSSRT